MITITNGFGNLFWDDENVLELNNKDDCTSNIKYFNIQYLKYNKSISNVIKTTKWYVIKEWILRYVNSLPQINK